MEEKNYQRYLEITAQIASLETEKKVLATNILEHLQKEGSERVTTNIGIISVKKRTGWKYAPAVKSKIEQIQTEAQENGEAEKTESVYLSTSIK